MRINRALASCGVASRRKAEALVLAGRVSVNGNVVKELGAQVDPERDRISVDGRRVKAGALSYFAYHKPRGVVSTLSDESGRPALGELCAGLPGRPRPIGRLDRASEGLLLLSSDGELAHRLTHPRYGVEKEYVVTVSPPLSDAHAQAMVSGVRLDDGPARFIGIELLEQEADRSRLSIVVAEGRYRLIRRVCEKLGYSVRRLKRVRLGPVKLGRLAVGETRALSGDEIAQLKRKVGLLG
jgi:pseudouridine synthase